MRLVFCFLLVATTTAGVVVAVAPTATCFLTAWFPENNPPAAARVAVEIWDGSTRVCGPHLPTNGRAECQVQVERRAEPAYTVRFLEGGAQARDRPIVCNKRAVVYREPACVVRLFALLTASRTFHIDIMTAGNLVVEEDIQQEVHEISFLALPDTRTLHLTSDLASAFYDFICDEEGEVLQIPVICLAQIPHPGFPVSIATVNATSEIKEFHGLFPPDPEERWIAVPLLRSPTLLHTLEFSQEALHGAANTIRTPPFRCAYGTHSLSSVTCELTVVHPFRGCTHVPERLEVNVERGTSVIASITHDFKNGVIHDNSTFRILRQPNSGGRVDSSDYDPAEKKESAYHVSLKVGTASSFRIGPIASTHEVSVLDQFLSILEIDAVPSGDTTAIIIRRRIDASHQIVMVATGTLPFTLSVPRGSYTIEVVGTGIFVPVTCIGPHASVFLGGATR